MTYEKIIEELKKKIYYPVYFLSGDEPYYIDLIADYIEKNVLTDSEKEFNQSVLYGKDVDILTMLSSAKRYPMMSNYQVVIVKEAQDIRNLTGKESKDKKDDKNPLLEYIQNPQKSTLLILCYKYKSFDRRTKLYKETEKHGVVFESAKVRDYKLPEWITEYVHSRGHRINPKASALVAESLGSDLSKIANEIDKMLLNIKAGKEVEIDFDLVEKNIGISKDFNIFEFTKALGMKNILKANQIANYFAANQKSNPMEMTIPGLYSYFMKILIYHRLPIKGRDQVAGALGVNPYFVSEYEASARVYPEHKVVNVISNLRDYDMRLKGVNNGSTDKGELLKELVYKILH